MCVSGSNASIRPLPLLAYVNLKAVGLIILALIFITPLKKITTCFSLMIKKV